MSQKPEEDYKTHISFTIPAGLVQEMRAIRREKGIAVSKQVTQGILLYLKSRKEAAQ